jgi:nucleotide-binding universal stress UspA family protein
MSATQILFLVVAGWMAMGLVAALLMGRRGHDPFRWWVLGAVFGPLVLILAIEGVLAERESPAATIEQGREGEGPIRVLVGIDGSAESLASLRAVTAVLGPRIGRLTLATVVPFDGTLPETDAGQVMIEAARVVADFHPTTVVLHGEPAHELGAFAEREGFDVLVVGNRGRGISRMLTGSVASQLLSTDMVPVMVFNRWGGQVRAESPPSPLAEPTDVNRL